MFSWVYEESIQTFASAEQVWKIWSRHETWPTWDDGVEWVKAEGPFAAGTTGVLKPKNGPAIQFEILHAEPLKGFQDRSFLPLTRLDFIHTFDESSHGKKARITHRIEMHGFLAPLFSRIIGKNIKAGLIPALRKLVLLAEKS